MIHEPFHLLVIYYALYSFYGWICETVYCSAWEWRYVRRGFLRGPYCPVYGAGALLVLELCLPHRDNPLMVFCIALVAASLVEYVTGWLFETLLRLRLWDYSGNRLNIKGRVCLLNSSLFGLLGLAALYLVHPPTVKLVALAAPELQRIIAPGLVIVMGLDFMASLNTAAGLTERLKAIGAQLEALRRQRGAGLWLDPADMPESIRLLRQKVARTLADNPARALLERLDRLAAQKDASWRIVRNYPGLTLKGLGQELAVLRQYLERDRPARAARTTQARGIKTAEANSKQLKQSKLGPGNGRKKTDEADMFEKNTLKTRHKEGASLALALVAGVLLILEGDSPLLPVLLLLNALAVVSIVMSASSVVRHADVLTHRFGEPYGSLILSLSIVFLEVSLISILMFSGSAGETLMRDTVYSIIIIVLAGLVGIALILGGHKYGSQRFNLSGIKHYLISIIPLSFIILVLPSTMEGGYSSWQLILVGLICLMLYAVFLRIQTRTHRNFFVYEHEDGHGAHGKPSPHSNRRHFAFMGLHLLAVIGVTELASGPLFRFMTAVNAPPAFTGLLVALLTLSPETTGAVRSILRNQVQRAMNLFLGSVLATISLTVPAVICIAALTGQHLVLGLDLPNIVLLSATLMVCQVSLTGGETNTHNGFAHAALFVVYVMLLFR